MPNQSDVRRSITTRITEALKQGTIPWRKPWSGVVGPTVPTNLSTLRRYSGLNIMLTWIAEQQHGWPLSYWATFQQFRSLGCNVPRGEKATTIVFWSQIKKTAQNANGEDVDRTIPFLKTWKVFNISQAEGPLVEKFLAKPKMNTFDEVDRTEFDRAVAATGAEIEYGHERAVYFRPPLDQIKMPDEGRFHSFPDFAKTLLHEIAHWSESRLEWTGSYPEGELRAEIASAFLASALGVPSSENLENVTAYLQSWLTALANDSRYIFKAASAASKATDFILSFSRQIEAQAEAIAEVA